MPPFQYLPSEQQLLVPVVARLVPDDSIPEATEIFLRLYPEPGRPPAPRDTGHASLRVNLHLLTDWPGSRSKFIGSWYFLATGLVQKWPLRLQGRLPGVREWGRLWD